MNSNTQLSNTPTSAIIDELLNRIVKQFKYNITNNVYMNVEEIKEIENREALFKTFSTDQERIDWIWCRIQALKKIKPVEQVVAKKKFDISDYSTDILRQYATLKGMEYVGFERDVLIFWLHFYAKCEYTTDTGDESDAGCVLKKLNITKKSESEEIKKLVSYEFNNSAIPTEKTTTYDIEIIKQLLKRRGIVNLKCQQVKEICALENINALPMTSDIKGLAGAKNFHIVSAKYFDKYMCEKKFNQYMYECIIYNPVKLFFDLEYDVKLGRQYYKDFIRDVQRVFIESFGEKLEYPLVFTNLNDEGQQVIKNSDNDKKKNEYSYHLHFHSQKRFKDCGNYLKTWVHSVLKKELKPEFKDFFDETVYSNTRSFRALAQSKYGREDQALCCINPEQLESFYNNEKFQTHNYSRDGELFLVQDIKYTGEYYNIMVEEQSNVDRLLSGDEDYTDEILNKPEKLQKKIIISSFEDILNGIPSDQPTAFKIMVAAYCKKNNHKELYIQWSGDVELENWNMISVSGNNKVEMRKILESYEPLFVGGKLECGNYYTQRYNPICCKHIGRAHNSNGHSLIVTKNSIKDYCYKTKNSDTIFKCASAQYITESYFTNILRFFYTQVIDTRIIDDFYKYLDDGYTFDSEHIEYHEDSERYVGDLTRFIKPKKAVKLIGLLRFMKNKNQDNEVNTLIVKSALGTGKSYSIEKLYQEHPEIYKRKLIITSRITYASAIKARYNKDGKVFKYYKDESDLAGCDNLIIQLESLHKIMETGCKLVFDLVILDEIESIGEQFSSTTFLHAKTKTDNIKAFKSIVKNARQVVLLDAFISDRTFRLVKLLRTGKVAYYNNKYVNGNLTFHELEHTEENFEDTIVKNMLEKLKAGEKLFCPINSKKSVQYIESQIAAAGYKVKSYHGDLTASEKFVGDANVTFKKYDVILATYTITIGISFDLEYFDSIFVLANDKCGTCRNLFQCIYRIRKLKSGNVYYLIQDVEKTITTSYTEKRREYDTVYNTAMECYGENNDITEVSNINKNIEWIADILATNDFENQMNCSLYRRIFNVFCRVQGYKNIEQDAKQKSDAIPRNDLRNCDIPLLTDPMEIIRIENIPSDGRTVLQRMQLIKLKIYDQTGIEHCERTFRRFKTNKMGYYFDMMMNDNHSYDDVCRLVLPDITEKTKNKSTEKLKLIKKFLQVVNPDNEADIYTDGVEFTGQDIAKFTKDTKKTLEHLKSSVKGSSFKIKKIKRCQHIVGDKKVDDFTNTTYRLEFGFTGKHLADYSIAVMRQEQDQYDDLETPFQFPMLTNEEYTAHVIDGLKKYNHNNR